jgi:hypothetical protein
MLLAGALFFPVLLNGCAARASYRVYDRSYSDYHVWDNSEVVFYQRWEFETHRDDQNFRKRHADEQTEYWVWRHNHHGDRH